MARVRFRRAEQRAQRRLPPERDGLAARFGRVDGNVVFVDIKDVVRPEIQMHAALAAERAQLGDGERLVRRGIQKERHVRAAAGRDASAQTLRPDPRHEDHRLVASGHGVEIADVVQIVRRAQKAERFSLVVDRAGQRAVGHEFVRALVDEHGDLGDRGAVRLAKGIGIDRAERLHLPHQVGIVVPPAPHVEPPEAVALDELAAERLAQHGD